MPDTESKPSEKKVRIVVFGDGKLACDADLLEDQGVALQGGAKLRTAGTLLVRDAVHWLTDAADLIAIPPKDVKDPQITLERKQTQWNRFFVLLGPILPLAAGLWVWYVRRG